MRIALVASRQDPAGMAIHQALLRTFPFSSTDSVFQESPVCRYETNGIIVSLYLLRNPLAESDNLERSIEADAFIFLSRHRSAAGTRSFAVHPIGNWVEEKGGGKARMLCPAMALLQHSVFMQLLLRQREGYEVTMEATHHGPYMEKPSAFVEIGSTEEEWKDEGNGKIVAESVMGGVDGYVRHVGHIGGANGKNAMGDIDADEQGQRGQKGHGQRQAPKVAVGVGGPHYCSSFNKLAQRKNIAFSHICPKYLLEKLDEGMLRQAIGKTHERVDFIVLDWKGLGREKQRIIEMLNVIGIPVERTDQLLKEQEGN